MFELGTRRVAILPDHDIAGQKHAAAIAESCLAAGLHVRVVELPDLPKGDILDWFAAGHTHHELLGIVKATPFCELPPTTVATSAVPVTPRTLADVEATFARWIRDEDPIPTRVVVTTYAANQNLDGDPVWAMLVGGSGVGKTERLTALNGLPDVVLASSITGPAALLSGSRRQERAADATGGLLRTLPEGGGHLIIKDFTSILEMHRDARAEVLAAFREVYDGQWIRHIGTDGGRTLTWTGRLGLLAGCTTAIDSAHAVMSVMGTRFVLVRLHSTRDIAGSALDHVGREAQMRNELREAMRGLLEHLSGTPHPIDADARAHLVALSSYVALARSPVDRDHQGEIRLVLDPEAPTRLTVMLGQLWRAAGLIGLDRSSAWAMVYRVGMDSIPKLRRALLDHLATCLRSASTTDLAEAVEHPSRTTRRALEDLVAHQLVVRTASGEGRADRWTLADQTRHWLDETLPDSSDSICSESADVTPANPSTPGTNVPVHIYDDKAGKVGDGDSPSHVSEEDNADGVF